MASVELSRELTASAQEIRSLVIGLKTADTDYLRKLTNPMCPEPVDAISQLAASLSYRVTLYMQPGEPTGRGCKLRVTDSEMWQRGRKPAIPTHRKACL